MVFLPLLTRMGVLRGIWQNGGAVVTELRAMFMHFLWRQRWPRGEPLATIWVLYAIRPAAVECAAATSIESGSYLRPPAHSLISSEFRIKMNIYLIFDILTSPKKTNKKAIRSNRIRMTSYF
ncbi:hypothetical protein J2T15_002001 [Paenibacillus harenae]|uniref:Secreted protein n=1 Tax=Paenibacillus harenae TaxID=306543 RepID=A0ABT9TYY9_PAEHA|nr:hypothetical protein [Paenibacillus harenae]